MITREDIERRVNEAKVHYEFCTNVMEVPDKFVGGIPLAVTDIPLVRKYRRREAALEDWRRWQDVLARVKDGAEPLFAVLSRFPEF